MTGLGTMTGHNRAGEPMTEDEQIPRVLVVDDEPNIRELVQVALKFHGCAVTPRRPETTRSGWPTPTGRT